MLIWFYNYKGFHISFIYNGITLIYDPNLLQHGIDVKNKYFYSSCIPMYITGLFGIQTSYNNNFKVKFINCDYK